MTKQDTEIASERESLRMLAEAQQRIAAACEQHGIRWTILQPTLIYKEGRDTNFTSLSRLIRRFGFMPRSAADRVCGNAEDLAIGAIAAAPAAVNQFYSLLGAETISYRERSAEFSTGCGCPGA